MNPIAKLVQRRIIKKLASVSPRQYCSLDDARMVGFAFDVNEPGIHPAVYALREELKRRNIRFKAVAVDFSDSHTQVTNYQSSPDITILYSSEVSFFKVPKHEFIDKFTKESYDIFFDLSIASKRLFPIDYSLLISNASFRIGFDPKMKSHYDFFISSHESSNYTLADYLSHTIIYLSTIKSNK